MKKKFVLCVIPVVVVLIFFVICGIFHKIKCKSENIELQSVANEYGTLVEVGNHKINIFVDGNEESDFVLVFMSGAGTCSPVLDFKSLYSLFKNDFQIVVVEKSGYGFSQDGNSDRSIETILAETRLALKKIGILKENQTEKDKKMILVPHSMSMLEALFWANSFPNEVDGIISLDGAIPKTYENMKINSFVLKLAQFANKIGLTRLVPNICNSSSAITDGTISDQEKNLYKKLFYKKTMTNPMVEEAKKVKENALKVKKIDKTEIPMILFVSNGIGTGYEKKRWNNFFYDYAKSRKNVQIKKLDCPHYVHNFEYESIYDESCKFLIDLLDEPELLQIFKDAYPWVKFKCQFDEAEKDWKINIKAENRKGILYWADGKFLPKEELKNKDLYSPFLYRYPKEIPDPKDFTTEDVERIRNFSNPKNRTEGKGTPPFLYDVIYDCKSRIAVESHIKSFSFLGKRSNPHEYTHKALEKVEKDILEAAKTDEEIKTFIEKLDSADSYSWRSISDSGNRSFHSLGLAFDILPKGWKTKNLYWAWRRDLDKENWMLLPLDRRWMPPQKVIEIFESHGFLWGGKWIIWDNMHFEYRPEVILYNKINTKTGEK